jgi:carbamoyltransferase
LLEDGKVVAAAAEERFSRQKHTRAFPHHALSYCLREAGVSLADVDCVAVSANPAIDLAKRSRRHSETIRYYPEALYAIPNHLGAFADFSGDAMAQQLGVGDEAVEVFYVTHHLTHAANAFFWSRFPSAAILTVDGRGEDETATFAVGSGDELSIIRQVPYPHSLGLFYGSVTEHLGFRFDRDEWKLMGLAAYGEPEGPLYHRLRELFELKPDGTFELDLGYFGYFLQPVNRACSSKFVSAFGPPRQPEQELTRHHKDLAAAAQRVLEEVLVHMLGALHREVGNPRVAVAGGTFMNSVFNGKIERVTPFQEAFISSCPDDSGTSIGAALYAHTVLKKQGRPEPQAHNYFGPAFDDRAIGQELALYKVPARRLENVEGYTAERLAQGKLVGWFQGRMEFGQRALGNRSILADPRDAANRDRVNGAVKFRESFRPFAPAVLSGDFREYFDVQEVTGVPHMERTLPMRPEKRALIPAVVHVDGSARPQTVTQDLNPRFHRLLTEFKKQTGLGVLMNTSFNLNDEPIVCTPRDAIRTFYSSGLDVLVLGNHVLEK